MMNTIGCLDRPTGGRYLLDGVDIGRLNRDQLADLRNRKLGFVFQGFNLLAAPRRSRMSSFPSSTAALLCQARDQYRRAKEAPEDGWIGGSRGHYPNQLSGGQQQRWLSPERWSISLECCWLMNPRQS